MCVCVILLVFHSCRDVVTTIILTARDKKLKIELKVQRAKVSPNRCVKTHQTASLRNSFRKPAQARKCLSSSSVTSVTSRRQSCQTGSKRKKSMASAKLPLKLLQGWIFGRKLQNVVHQSALRHTHDNLHDVGRSLISSCSGIHAWLNGGTRQPLVLLDHSRHSWSSF